MQMCPQSCGFIERFDTVGVFCQAFYTKKVSRYTKCYNQAVKFILFTSATFDSLGLAVKSFDAVLYYAHVFAGKNFLKQNFRSITAAASGAMVKLRIVTKVVLVRNKSYFIGRMPSQFQGDLYAAKTAS